MRVFILALCLICCKAAFAQQSQQVTGRVEDYTTRAGLNGANIILTQDSVRIGTAAEAGGFFVLNNVFPGRYTLTISFTGYETVQQELLVISARRTEAIVQLREFQTTLGEVEILSSRTPHYEPGEHSITNEKALRLPANFFDPVRIITSYPGVMTANDQNNIIVIRGNSPTGLLWKINGLDVVNPNHLANAGTFSDKPAAYGGGVNIISSQLMERTDFYTGTQPAQYGNALSGIIDMKLRGGDTTDYKYTAQASLLGIDLAAEGPVGRKKNTSFLANYRYSTVGLLSAMGVKFGDEDIRFQDLTFSLNSSWSDNRSLAWFGFIGASDNSFSKDPDEREVEKDLYNVEYDSKNFGTGLVFNQTIKKTNLSAGLSISASEQTRNQVAQEPLMIGGLLKEDLFALDKLLVSAFGRVSTKFNNSSIESGLQINYLKDDISQVRQVDAEPRAGSSGSVEGVLLQPYAQWNIQISDRLNAQTGIRYAYFTYNQTGSVEPRIGLEFLSGLNSSVKVSYNLVSQLQSVATYSNDNADLEMTKAHHFDLQYTVVSGKGFRFSTTAYYQNLFDVPVDAVSSSYSLLNAIEASRNTALVSEGTGNNYGIEMLTEQSFFDKSYFIAGASWYQSRYKGSDGIERDTRFNGTYSATITYGREWTKTKKNSQRSFGLSTRAMYLGGLRESPIVPDQANPETVYNDTKAFENKLKDYFRLDLRLNWRKNKKGYTRTIAIDIQNLLNVQNEAYHYYDHVKQRVITQYQLGLIPVLVYRIDF